MGDPDAKHYDVEEAFLAVDGSHWRSRSVSYQKATWEQVGDGTKTHPVGTLWSIYRLSDTYLDRQQSWFRDENLRAIEAEREKRESYRRRLLDEQT